MNIRSFFKRPSFGENHDAPASTRKRQIPEGLWTKCPSCSATVYNEALAQNAQVCPECGHHFRLSAPARIRHLFDEGSWEAMDQDVRPEDPLEFPKYRERLTREAEKDPAAEAILTGVGAIQGVKVSAGVMNFGFLGGSMGSVVGERLVRAVDRSIDKRMPLLVVCASGGARMHEGVLSLMQMAKVCAALEELSQQAVPFVSLLTDPTFGGVTASFATLGDLILAEPRAMIGFAGPDVISNTIRQPLPAGFQTAEFLLERGLIDRIVPRKEQRDVLAACLAFMKLRAKR